MRRRLLVLLSMFSVILLSACGGGGSGGSDAVCADLRYQEDAQAPYAAGAKQLDRDNDGIACEDLPRRPLPPPPTGGGSGGGGTTLPPAPPYNFMNARGETVAITPTGNGQYALSFWGPITSVSDPGPINPITNFGVTQVTSQSFSVRFTPKAVDLLPAWAGPNAIGFTSVNRFLSDVSGIYRAIGQSCPQGLPPCTPVVGTLMVVENGTMWVCENQDVNTGQCTNPLVLPVTRTSTDPAGMFRLDNVTARLISSYTGSLAVSYQNAYESPTNPRPTFVRTTWFAVRYGLDNLQPLGVSNFEGFDNIGAVVSSPANGWALQDNVPMAGVRRDASGRLLLKSNNGQLITWSPEQGLQAFVAR